MATAGSSKGAPRAARGIRAPSTPWCARRSRGYNHVRVGAQTCAPRKHHHRVCHAAGAVAAALQATLDGDMHDLLGVVTYSMAFAMVIPDMDGFVHPCAMRYVPVPSFLYELD